MKVLSIVLIVVFLFMSCGTLSEVERIEETGIDNVKETEMSQEEFEGIFGKKEYSTSIDGDDVEITNLDPLVLGDVGDLEVSSVVEEDIPLDDTIFEEIEIVMPESGSFFPSVVEESEWFCVPEIEIIEEAKVIEQEKDVSSPTPPDTSKLIVLYQSEEKSAEHESLSDVDESALEEQETVLESEIGSVEAISIGEEDEFFITIEEILSGQDKVEPRMKSILMFFAAKPLLSAIILSLVAFGSIGYIVMSIEKKRSSKGVDVNGSIVPEENVEESEEEPLSPSPDIIGVPENNGKEKMDIREGEESYSTLVEKMNLSVPSRRF